MFRTESRIVALERRYHPKSAAVIIVERIDGESDEEYRARIEEKKKEAERQGAICILVISHA